MKTQIRAILLLISFLLFARMLQAQTPSITYGDNPATGKYVTLNGVKHYMEADSLYY